MPCNVPSSTRKLLFECQEGILNKFNILEEKRKTVNNISYLCLFVAADEYTRIEAGEKSSFKSTFANSGFVLPKKIQVGFSASIPDNYSNLHDCLSFLATSSISTSYTTYIPITVIDYVRPEAGDRDLGYTIRKGMLTVDPRTGTEGDSTVPEWMEGELSFTFMEIGKRLIM